VATGRTIVCRTTSLLFEALGEAPGHDRAGSALSIAEYIWQ
jgi:hypothetical protein